jgi:non-specific serine/threonine protein kinase
MTPEDLLERLDDRFRLLAVDGGHNFSRSQTLRATVDWSHGLLGEEERILWRRLSVFAGGCDIEAAEAVCSGAGLERERVVDVIGNLVDRSILTMRHGERRGRYLLLETMRLYGAERLREAGEEAELRRRHATWYAQLVTGGEPVWWESADQADILDLLDVEWANVEAALEFWAESGPDAEPGLAMATNLWLYWDVRGSYRIGRRHLEAFLALVPAPTATRALALCSWGSHAQSTGDYDVALAGFEEARRISIEVGADRELAHALFGIGIAGLRLGKLELALQSLAASRETMLRLDNAMGRALALYFLAMAVEGAGQLAEARRLALEGLEASERAGDMYVRGVLNTLLGVVEWRLHDVQAAEERLEEAVRTQDGIGHRLGIAESLEGLAWVAASTGRLERASRLLGAADALWEELGNALLPTQQLHHDACEAAARAGLGEARYRAAWDEGRALGRGREVAAAVEETISREQRAPAAMAEYDAFALSARELEVARLVADGLSNNAIAAALFLSVATIKTHVSHILRKLALDSRVQLASWVAAHDPGDTTLARR